MSLRQVVRRFVSLPLLSCRCISSTPTKIDWDGKKSDLPKNQFEQALWYEPMALFMRGTIDQPACEQSALVAEIITKSHVRYRSYDILADEEMRQTAKSIGGSDEFPQIWINGKLAADAALLSSLAEKGKITAFFRSHGLDFTDVKRFEGIDWFDTEIQLRYVIFAAATVLLVFLATYSTFAEVSAVDRLRLQFKKAKEREEVDTALEE